MNNKLSPLFLEELFKLLTLKKTMLEICRNNLKYSHIPKELGEYKLIYKSLLTQYENSGKLPSIGVASQQYEHNIDVQEALSKIKDSDVKDEEIMISQLEVYIRSDEFLKMNKHVAELFMNGDKDEAVDYSMKESARINGISLRSSGGKFAKVFGGFNRCMEESRAVKEERTKFKVPFYIDPIDDMSRGGMENKDLAMWIFRSGVGKSTALKWTGMQACLAGFDVLHFQLEDSEEKCIKKYSQIFSSLDFSSISSGNIPESIQKKIDRLIADMEARSKDIYVYAFDKFGDPTMIEIRDIIIEYEKIMGKMPDLVIIDSLDLCKTGENKKVDTDPDHIKHKLKGCARLMKNICKEFDLRILTAMQTGDIPPSIWNDPDKVITRSNTEGDRTLIQPFDWVFTGNQTDDEYEKDMLRIYYDKTRYYKPKNKIAPICTNYDRGAFYAPKKTMSKFYNI